MQDIIILLQIGAFRRCKPSVSRLSEHSGSHLNNRVYYRHLPSQANQKNDLWFYRVIGPLVSLTDKLISIVQRCFKGIKAWENPKPEPELAPA